MKLRLPLMILCACGGLLLGTGTMCPTQAGVFSFEQYLPYVDTSFEDLDARDAANQPIKSMSVINELKEIFQAGMFSLLVRSELHSVAQALSIIEKKLNLAVHSLARQLPKMYGQLLSAILSSSKQWEKMLTRLCNLPGIDLLVVGISLFAPLVVLTASTATPFVFRC